MKATLLVSVPIFNVVESWTQTIRITGHPYLQIIIWATVPLLPMFLLYVVKGFMMLFIHFVTRYTYLSRSGVRSQHSMISQSGMGQPYCLSWSQSPLD